mgnify:CR=1 FL=1
MPRVTKKTLSFVMVCIMLVTTLMACSNQNPASNTATPSNPPESSAAPPAPKEPEKPAYKELTVYSALPDTEIPTYFNAFEKDTGIKINYVRLSAGEMLARISAEKANPLASVMHGGSSDTYIAAAKEGLLEPYQSSELANIPEQYKDPEKIWNPFYVGAISFACNKDWFTKNSLEYPKSWQDLLKPEFKGQISMAHPSTSGTSYTVLATIIQLMGEEKAWEYLAALNKNVRQYTKAGAAPPMEVGLGEAAIAITFSHDGLKPAMEGYPIELSFPSEGTGFEVGAVALIKGGNEKEQENARLFIDWTLSKRAQELFIDSKSNRVPLNSTAKATDGLIKIEDLKIIDYDAVWAGQNKKDLVAKFNEKIDAANNLKQ